MIVVPVLARAHGKPHTVHRYSRVIVAAGGPAPSSGPAAMPQTYLQQPVTQCNVTAAHSLKTQRRRWQHMERGLRVVRNISSAVRAKKVVAAVDLVDVVDLMKLAALLQLMQCGYIRRRGSQHHPAGWQGTQASVSHLPQSQTCTFDMYCLDATRVFKTQLSL